MRPVRRARRSLPVRSRRTSELSARYLCCHLGGRFSTKALVPFDAIGTAEDYAEGFLLEAQATVLLHRECGSQRGFRLTECDR